MHHHPLCQIIAACDRAISTKNFDALMTYYAEDAALVVRPGRVVTGKDNIRNAFIAIANYFQDKLTVEQGNIEIIEGGGAALVIMETRLQFPDEQGESCEVVRRATYVFRRESDERWLCTIDNSYGTDLLDEIGG